MAVKKYRLPLPNVKRVVLKEHMHSDNTIIEICKLIDRYSDEQKKRK